MGTAHGTKELGLCSHGLAYQANARGRYKGYRLGYGHIWRTGLLERPAKIFCEADNFDKPIFAC